MIEGFTALPGAHVKNFLLPDVQALTSSFERLRDGFVRTKPSRRPLVENVKRFFRAALKTLNVKRQT